MSLRRAAKALLPAALGLLLATAAPLGAEIVIFTEGSFLEVHSFRVEEERAFLETSPGGWMVVPLVRVDRILDDEVPTPIPEPPAPEVAQVALPLDFEMSFQHGQAAPAAPYGEMIQAAAQRYGLNPALIAAVARAESGFQPKAVSVKGARGLMQLMPATAKRFGLERAKVHDPAANIDAGSQYLKFLVERFPGDLRLVLAAYNAGEGTIARYGGVPPYRETREYIRRIYQHLGLAAPAIAG